MTTTVRIAGTGSYAPGAAIDNDELVALTGIELNRERLEAKIGIRARHIAHLREIDETAADFAERAIRGALAAAAVEPGDIGMFVVGTDTPEYISPATAVVVQGRIQEGQTNAVSFDINTSCAGFVTALDVAASWLASHPQTRYAAVAGVYNMPAFVRPGDAFGYSIFADGAGAVILERSADGGAYRHGTFVSDGTQWNYVGIYTGGARQPATAERIADGEWGLQLLQRLPGDRNVKLWPAVVRRLLDEAGASLADVDHIIFTQINRSVIEEVMGILELPMERTTTVMDRFGYTGSACIPMALHDAVSRGAIRRGDTVVTIASGAGLTVGANLFTY